MDSPVQIVKKEYIRSDIVKSFMLQMINVELNKSVSFSVLLMDEHSRLVDVKNFTLQGEEYHSWGNDDTYLYRVVAEKLGFTLE